MSHIALTAKFTNIYEDGEEVELTKTITVETPPDDLVLLGRDDKRREEWAYENLHPHTGTGKEEGDAGYFVEIIECEADTTLVGMEFEWGI